ncbi:MAG: TIGR04255 family protein [Azospirillum sp.]|nr:TIGR04255 family protein [Azospirillum sp.]
MDYTHYKAAPITEAIVELKLASPMPEREQRDISEALKHLYELSTKQIHVDLDVNMIADLSAGEGRFDAKQIQKPIFRLSNIDQTELCIITHQAIIVSQLAPYPGWDVFFDRIKKTLTTIGDAATPRPRQRLGVRYINRIDLPMKDPTIAYEDYIKVYVGAPEELGANVGYSGNIRFYLPDLNGHLIIQSASTKSPIPRHAAFILDIDIGIDVDVPLKNEDLFDLLLKIRAHKNRAFDLSTTEMAKKKFGS